ncbi:hypothetical protein M1271_01770 [Patescibacteria group bacterium]|nr:hypothetical protein [Patescibacteria group bacterium]MCL5797179.1 hypothetical protein [Patescibacteria group bacterium]
MKLHKVLLFIFILPVTLFLDLVFYALTNNCPSCGNGFAQWVTSEGALSFPIVVGLTEWFSQMFTNLKTSKK